MASPRTALFLGMNTSECIESYELTLLYTILRLFFQSSHLEMGIQTLETKESSFRNVYRVNKQELYIIKSELVLSTIFYPCMLLLPSTLT